MEWRHLTEVLTKYAETLYNTYRGKLDSEGITASGKLRDTLKYEIKFGDSSIEVGLWLQEYYKAIDNGRLPTMNGGDGELRRKILEWIRVKPVLPRPVQLKSGKSVIPSEEQLAYLISRKIHKFGYEGRNVLKRSIEEVNDAFMLDIQYAIMEDIKDDLQEILIRFNHIEI